VDGTIGSTLASRNNKNEEKKFRRGEASWKEDSIVSPRAMEEPPGAVEAAEGAVEERRSLAPR
jgi:hypothetical protein